MARIAFFTSDDYELEAHGFKLLDRVARSMRDIVPDLVRDIRTGTTAPYIQPGPGFDHHSAPELFGPRNDVGPLRIDWDTNLLLHYFEIGNDLWFGEVDGDHGQADEMEALLFLFALWIIRDVRFRVSKFVLGDARKKLSEGRRLDRLNAVHETARALSLLSVGEEDHPAERTLQLPTQYVEGTLAKVPAGGDRVLVRDAVQHGAHVFLTLDNGVLRSDPHVRTLGLRVLSPGGLFDLLLEHGFFHCFLAPQFAYWPAPDQARVTHLLRALPSGGT